MFFGPLKTPEVHEPVTDMKLREWAALGPVMALCLLLGIFPQPILKTMDRDIAVVANILKNRDKNHL
jgi:NADH-quinone oxidoreductase subunit M